MLRIRNILKISNKDLVMYLIHLSQKIKVLGDWCRKWLVRGTSDATVSRKTDALTCTEKRLGDERKVVYASIKRWL